MRSRSTYFLISLILYSGCASSSDESSASNPSATQDAEGQSAGSARNVEEPTELNNATANEHTANHTIETTPESSPAPTIAANGSPMLLESIDTEAHMRQSRSVDTSTPHNWLTLKAEGSRFSIDTPWKLHATQQTVPTKAGPASANILSADYKTAGIVLMYADYPPTAGMSTKFMAEKVLNPIMSSLLRRMKASNPVTEEFEEHGFHGLECRTDIKTGYCRIHAILVDHRVYQIVVFTDGKLLTDADVDRVISSFRFDVPPTPKPSSAIGATKPLSPEKLQNAFWKEANGSEVVVRGRIRHIRLFQDANPVLCSATVRLYDWNMPDVIDGVDAMFLTAPKSMRFNSPEDVHGLRREQEVIIRGRINHALERLDSCRIVKRLQTLKHAPSAMVVLSHEEREIDRLRLAAQERKGVEIDQYSRTVFLHNGLPLINGKLPDKLVNVLSKSRAYRRLVVSVPLSQALIEQVSTFVAVEELILGVVTHPGVAADLGSIDLSPLGKIKSLNSIQFPMPKHLQDAHFEQLSRFPYLSNLSVLFPEDSQLTDAALLALKNRRSLRFLNIEHFGDLPFSDAGYAALGRVERLRRISVVGENVTGSCLTSLGKHRLLRVLHLHGQSIDDESLDTFSKQSWKGLRTLKISSRNVGDKGAISLGSSMPPMLGHLTFQFTTIGDKGVERLIASPPPTLVLLDLSGTKMTDKGAMLCKSLTSLSTLILPKEISEDVIADLQKALPEAKVYRDQQFSADGVALDVCFRRARAFGMTRTHSKNPSVAAAASE